MKKKHNLDRVGASPKTFGPDLLDDPRTNPRMEWIKHQFTRQMEMDRFIRSPAMEMIDWGTAGPGPDREPPCGNGNTGALVDWERLVRSTPPEALFPRTVNRTSTEAPQLPGRSVTRWPAATTINRNPVVKIPVTPGPVTAELALSV